MSAELITAIAGLGGAGLGGIAAVWGSTVTAKTQLRTSRAQLEATATTEQAKARHAAFVDFARACVQFEMAWRTLLISMQTEADQEEQRQHYGEMRNLERDRWTTYAVLLLEAPSDVKESAKALNDAYAKLHKVASMHRLKLANDKSRSEDGEEFESHADRCAELLDAFANATQQLAAASWKGALPAERTVD